MTDFFVPQLDPNAPKKHLSSLQTPFGERSVYDSVSFCNRCGSCQQACPTYLLSAQETFSPRGRNQAVRLLMERKITVAQNRALLQELAASCLLCGRCTQACAGKIPTAQHMLELRRALGGRWLPGGLHFLLSCRARRPRLFAFLVQTARVLRRMGAVRLMRMSGLLALPPLSWIRHADDILPRALHEKERKQLLQQTLSPVQNPTLIYLPSLEAQWLMPDLGASVLAQAAQKHSVLVWNAPSGLFEYVYGDLRQSRRLLRRLIRRHQHTAGGRLPVLTDSIDVYLFFRSAPQLFDRWPSLQKQARRFAACVCFVTDILKPRPQKAEQKNVRLDYSALFSREGEVFDRAQKILKTQFKKNFVECWYKDADTPAFGYSFVRPDWAEPICMQAVRSIARTQTGTVFTLSGLSALELGFYLKRFYPHAQADHLVRLNG
ncbi:(Fe-S)-binding protein [Candidatus Avelusimicrobium gallicola]|uniref:4Fe-4S ferredoxin-type domain-containing protein n=1 Tax=Candidatus Avelusimicrobium gallicola TaxID=2562704 RepID=A0A1Y4DAD8_9BACT|nr:(Fe-S)-binding protein [Elusimicrobium sp. An273]OUO56036.1 hypothetical protein B5F75_07085 [Elusimicrobium sp. An273]